MLLYFLGTGEATDEINYNTSFLLTTNSQKKILFDCGYSIPNRIWRKDSNPDLLDIFFISHTHADHSFGFPIILLRMFLDMRTKPLKVVCPSGCREELLEICRLAYETLLDMIEFNLEFVEVESGDDFEMDGLRWRFARTMHPRKNLAVRLDEVEGKSLAYSGDGDITRSAKELYQNLDCLIHDSYSFQPLEEIHTQIEDTVELAKEQSVKHLFLTHIKRNERTSDDFQKLVELSHDQLEIFAPIPGETFEF